jgi:hypothetical protein
MAIQLTPNEQARDKFFNSPHGTFGISDIPPEVFARFNVHKQQRLLEGHKTNVNPAYFKSIKGSTATPTQGTSLLGAGRSAPGPMTQPQAIQESFNPPASSPSYAPIPEQATSPVPSTPLTSQPEPTQFTTQPVSTGGGGDKRWDATPEGRRIGNQLHDLISAEDYNPNSAFYQQKTGDLLMEAAQLGLTQSLIKTLPAATQATIANTMSTIIPGTPGTFGPGMFPPSDPGTIPSLGTAGTTVGAALTGASYGFIGNTLSELVMGEEGLQTDVGSGVGGAIGFAVGGPIGAGIGSFLGGIAGAAFGGPSIHAGEEAVGESFLGIQNAGHFTGDANADFAKNLALARIKNPQEGDDSTGDGLHEIAGRVNVNVKEQTILGFKQLIEEGHVPKQDILDSLAGDLELYRKDIESITEPQPITETPVALPDTFFEAPPEPPTTPEPQAVQQESKPKTKAKEKPKTPTTNPTGPQGVKSEPVLFKPSLARFLNF